MATARLTQSAEEKLPGGINEKSDNTAGRPQIPRRPIFSRRILPVAFRITREGLIFLAGILILYAAAINSGNNLLFIILAALLSTMAVSGVVSRSSLKRLSLTLQVPENVFVGERVPIKVSVKNSKRLFPSFSIRVEDPELSRKHSLSGMLEKLFFWKKNSGPDPFDRAMLRKAAYFPILRAGETRSELTVQSFPQRGHYSLEGFWISTRFPFGFFRRGERVEANGVVLVYPSIRDISDFFHLLPFLPGHMEGPHAGQGENLFSMREYQETESVRIIDWKATAKTGRLMARQYARDEESKFCLIFDTRMTHPLPDGSKEAFEKAVSLAAGIAAHFSREGAGMEFLTPNEHIPRGAGIDHLYRILRSLAVIDSSAAQNQDRLWNAAEFGGAGNEQAVREIFSDKIFKIILTSSPRGSFPSTIWRSSHVIYFNEL